MKRIFYFIALAALCMSVGCATQKITYRESSARIVEPGLSAIITPLIADMELISEERIAPYTEEFPIEVTQYTTRFVDGFKRTALLNAAKRYGADVIVGAIIDVGTTPQGTYSVTVTGYPARWVNFRNATADDLWMVDMNRMVQMGDNTAVLRGAERQQIKIEKKLQQ